MGSIGYKHTPEAIEKIRIASIGNQWNVGKKASIETRKRMSLSMKGKHVGRKHTEVSRRNMSAAHVGYKQTPEQIAKRVIKQIGRKLPPRSEEFKARMSEIKKGTPCPEHVKILISKLHSGKIVSEETRARMSAAQKKRSTQSPFYIDGRCAERMHERTIASNSFEYKQWRRLVFKRDNYTCQECWIKGGSLNADHVLPWAFYPELRYEVSNGKTLCVPCHRKTPTYGLRKHTAR